MYNNYINNNNYELRKIITRDVSFYGMVSNSKLEVRANVSMALAIYRNNMYICDLNAYYSYQDRSMTFDESSLIYQIQSSSNIYDYYLNRDKDEYEKIFSGVRIEFANEIIEDFQITLDKFYRDLKISNDVNDYIITREDENNEISNIRKKRYLEYRFGRVNEDWNVEIFYENGERETRLELFQDIYDANDNIDVSNDHPNGLVISLNDAKKIGLKIVN